ncbi:MAG: YicC family protein [Candidatus Cloacimonetes bacterium]|nr:YicC family protein [Candidatus Cloacimonadota bacterium]
MKSMTGYGRAKYSDKSFDLEIEVKSVNSRFLDIRIKQPSLLFFLESALSKRIQQVITRGKVDLYIHLNLLEIPNLELNEELIKIYWDLYKKAKNMVGTDQPLPFAKLLSENGIISTANDVEEENLSKIIFQTLDEAISEHQKMSETEGDSMKTFCLSSSASMVAALKKIKKQFPKYKKKVFSKLKKNVKNLIGDMISEEDHKKMLTETAIYVEKADITEEIIRLEDHINKFNSLMKIRNDVGKKLNFILQEMHREINTIGSKFNSTEVLNDVIFIKEEIEKCREIVQNVR